MRSKRLLESRLLLSLRSLTGTSGPRWKKSTEATWTVSVARRGVALLLVLQVLNLVRYFHS